MLNRRSTLALVAGATLLPFAPSAMASEPAKTLRVGYQKSGPLALVKRRGSLEAKLAADGVSVTWSEFPSGPPLLEALGAGALDFGYTGDVPPLFAQSARSDLVYVAAGPAPGSQSAILVQAAGPIRTVADLKGRTLAFVRGSSAHNVAVSTLATAGLSLKDVTVVPLAPADAATAFASGQIDAWSIWDPYFAIAERNPGTRVLTTAEGIVDTYNFYLANGAYAKANPLLIRQTVGEVAAVADWSQAHLDETATAISQITGVPEDVTRIVVNRHNARFVVGPVTDEVIRVQQKTADTFFAAGLIPKKLDIRSIVWTPPAS
jgi:sulfonate transport system substrate-binding protein